jgi:hypothetical protein
MREALATGCDCVITIGGIQSNHCRATAAAARLVGLEPHLILRCPAADVETDPGLVGNLLLDRMLGATLHLVTVGEYATRGQAALTAALAGQLTKEGRRPYVIPVGGSSALGTWGYLNAVEELRRQVGPGRKGQKGEGRVAVGQLRLGRGSGATEMGSGSIFTPRLATDEAAQPPPAFLWADCSPGQCILHRRRHLPLTLHASVPASHPPTPSPPHLQAPPYNTPRLRTLIAPLQFSLFLLCHTSSPPVLPHQLLDEAPRLGSVDHIVFACGSGGTAAGVALGARLARMPQRVHAVGVCDSPDAFYDQVRFLFLLLPV